MLFYFVGSESSVSHIDPATGHVMGAPTVLNRFGASFDGSEEEAKDWMKGGCALLTEDEFKSCEFTPAELEAFQTPGTQRNAPDDFKEKQKKAWGLYGAKWQELHGLTNQPTLTPVVVATPLPSSTLAPTGRMPAPPDVMVPTEHEN